MSSKRKFTIPSLDDMDSHVEKMQTKNLFQEHQSTIRENLQKSPNKNKPDARGHISTGLSKQQAPVTDTPTSNVQNRSQQANNFNQSKSLNVQTQSNRDGATVSPAKQTGATLQSAAGADTAKKTLLSAVGSTNACTAPTLQGKSGVSSTCILVNSRQRGNPILKYVKNVPLEYDDIVPDYQLGRTSAALYLSLRYHLLNPQYIHTRLKQLGHSYDLRVLLVQVDIKDSHHSLKELAKISILTDCTLVLAFSPEEAGRYLETFKSFENKPPDLIMEKTETNYLGNLTDCLTSAKKVNKTDAMTLLSSFKSFKNMVEASEEDLSLCPGFGPQKAQRLSDVFNEPFKKQKKVTHKPTTSAGT